SQGSLCGRPMAAPTGAVNLRPWCRGALYMRPGRHLQICAATGGYIIRPYRVRCDFPGAPRRGAHCASDAAKRTQWPPLQGAVQHDPNIKESSMELLLSALAGLPEFSTLASLLTAGETAALSGVGQLPRSHFLAGLTRAVSRPALILCPDDQSAQTCQIELAAFLGAAPALLPSREFTFCEAAVVSRGWEQRRLHLLWKLGKGQIPILVSSLEALSLRTMPPAVLFSAATTLRPGASFDLEDLSRRLTAAGYARTSLVEGVGQFSIRGGILDVFSPA